MAPFWIFHRILVTSSTVALIVIKPPVASKADLALPTVPVNIVLGDVDAPISAYAVSVP